MNAQVEFEATDEQRQLYSSETGLDYDVDSYRLHALRARIGQALAPEIKGSDLRGRGLAAVSRRVVNSAIQEALSARNAALPHAQHIAYQQVINITYKDDARMQSIGGVFYEVGERNKVDACAFDELDFVLPDDEPYEIKVPCLTLKEMRHISAHLPKANGDAEAIELPGVPPSDVQDFAELYRYFPTFAEAVFT